MTKKAYVAPVIELRGRLGNLTASLDPYPLSLRRPRDDS